MKYTPHGHAIPQTEHINEPAPMTRARCGGPLTCAECSQFALRFIFQDAPETSVLRPYVEEIPTEFVSSVHRMDPTCEDVIWGTDLQVGMVVILEDAIFRHDARELEELEEGSIQYDRLLNKLNIENRYFRITSIRNSRSDIIEMIGEYADGVKHKRSFNVVWTWIVRIK